MSEKNIRKQINYCKSKITRLNKEYKDKKHNSKKEIQNKFNTEINELKSTNRALTKNDDKTAEQNTNRKEKKQMLKSLKNEIRAIKKTKAIVLKEKLKKIKKEKRSQIKKIKDEIKALKRKLYSMRITKIFTKRYLIGLRYKL